MYSSSQVTLKSCIQVLLKFYSGPWKVVLKFPSNPKKLYSSSTKVLLRALRRRPWRSWCVRLPRPCQCRGRQRWRRWWSWRTQCWWISMDAFKMAGPRSLGPNYWVIKHLLQSIWLFAGRCHHNASSKKPETQRGDKEKVEFRKIVNKKKTTIVGHETNPSFEMKKFKKVAFGNVTNQSGWLLWGNTFEPKFDAGIKFRKTLFYAHKSIFLRPTFDDAVYIKQRNQSITRIFKGTIETASPPLMFIWSGGSTMSLIVRIRPIRADRNQREGDTDSVLYLVFKGHVFGI